MKLKMSFIAILLLTLSACGSSQSDTGNDSYSAPEAQQGDSYNAPEEEQENPYDDGTGHDAGYKWAERTGGDCNGNSASFNEGCEEYQRQQGN